MEAPTEQTPGEHSRGAHSPSLTPSDGPAHDRANKYKALCVRSGNVLVLGLRDELTTVQCAGMALVRVFQGHVTIMGFQPAHGTYFSLYSPKWSSAIVIQPQAAADAQDTPRQRVDAEHLAPFTDTSARLLRQMEPSLQHVIDMDEEHTADGLAQEVAEDYPVVLVFRVVPVTYGNVVCFYERIVTAPSVSDQGTALAPLVLPGFKMIVNHLDHNALNDAVARTQQAADSSNDAALAAAAPSMATTTTHDWKDPTRVLREFAVLDTVRTIEITPAWQQAVDAIDQGLQAATTPQKIVVCGAKGVGKSTFCRYLVNRLLSRFDVVAFLDTDLGQPELTPPGLVSLHALAAPLLGPGFTHMKTPLRSFFCGGTNASNDPLHYMKAIRSLLKLYHAKWNNGGAEQSAAKAVPLVINTDGWIKSMGHDLLCHVIDEASPNHVVQLLATTKNKQFALPTEGNWQVHSVAPWEAQGSSQPPRGSKEMRLYRFHSYFLSQSVCSLERPQLQNLHLTSEKNRLDDHLARAYCHLAPVAVSFDAVDIAFAGCSVPPSQLLYSLNSSLVGLCINPRRRSLQSRSQEADAANGSLAYRTGPPRTLLHPAHAPCVGMAIIRAVDMQRRLLYLLTPVSGALLQQVNLLVRSTIPLGSLVEDVSDPIQAPHVVADTLNTDGTGASVMKSRNNIKRKRDDGARP
ncbi:TPA: hypothetical protein N0F65_009945 [Lagenidium giganteum]|uniref:Polynucleotide 5'-hydroxyl-kinase NOL9 n=1 Tax=Lagenidium giganteum TaxID=4803 RepID=A0AAV2YR25_9STRA|nr:TPA: hypothetical protein N0F65_009945 [Lagenidium giganteum]